MMERKIYAAELDKPVIYECPVGVYLDKKYVGKDIAVRDQDGNELDFWTDNTVFDCLCIWIKFPALVTNVTVFEKAEDK